MELCLLFLLNVFEVEGLEGLVGVVGEWLVGGCGPWKFRGVLLNDGGRGRSPALSEVCL